jgi:hypothetical protein
MCSCVRGDPHPRSSTFAASSQLAWRPTSTRITGPSWSRANEAIRPVKWPHARSTRLRPDGPLMTGGRCHCSRWRPPRVRLQSGTRCGLNRTWERGRGRSWAGRLLLRGEVECERASATFGGVQAPLRYGRTNMVVMPSSHRLEGGSKRRSTSLRWILLLAAVPRSPQKI